MPRHARIRLTLAHKISAATIAAAGAAALALTVVPGTAIAHDAPRTTTFSAASASFTTAARHTAGAQRDGVTRQYWQAHHQWWLKKKAAEAKAKAEAEAKAKAAAHARWVAHLKAVAAAKKAAAAKAAAAAAAAKTAAAPAAKAATASTVVYANNLDGWIKHALAIMKANGIPGTYDGIYRNVMRESSGNPNAINLWDSNAAAGHPSKGLLQTIDSTFNAYHVAGTSWNIYDPVANIVAACNYAYHVYGSIDNVNGPY